MPPPSATAVPPHTGPLPTLHQGLSVAALHTCYLSGAELRRRPSRNFPIVPTCAREGVPPLPPSGFSSGGGGRGQAPVWVQLQW